jgi:hypothetical protein
MDPGASRGGVVSTTPRLFKPQERNPLPILQEAGWTSLDWSGKFRPPTGVQTPDRPTRSNSLYRLRNPGQWDRHSPQLISGAGVAVSPHPHQILFTNYELSSNQQIKIPRCLFKVTSSHHSQLFFIVLCPILRLMTNQNHPFCHLCHIQLAKAPWIVYMCRHNRP